MYGLSVTAANQRLSTHSLWTRKESLRFLFVVTGFTAIQMLTTPKCT
jgi:fatty-acid desaturase